MSTILPFRKPSARTSPQHEPASVAVNATACARDLFVEARIRVLDRVIGAAEAAGDLDTARNAKADLYALRCGLLRASKARSESR